MFLKNQRKTKFLQVVSKAKASAFGLLMIKEMHIYSSLYQKFTTIVTLYIRKNDYTS